MQFFFAKYNIALTVFQASWAREASAHLQGGQPVALHLKVDTGMGRIGTRDKEETQELVLTIEKYPSLNWKEYLRTLPQRMNWNLLWWNSNLNGFPKVWPG